MQPGTLRFYWIETSFITRSFIKIFQCFLLSSYSKLFPLRGKTFLKITFATKLFFRHKVALDLELINFFIWKKNCFVLEISRFLRNVKSTDFKIFDVIYIHFFWIVSTIKMKFGQILMLRMPNIPNGFLAHCLRLETNSRHFHDFTKMTI